MRDIKFRAWNPNANKFDSYAGVINMSLGEAGALWAKNIPMEFQQYTGLKDKNGVEIYEGDIVDEFGRGENMPVVFDDKRACYYIGKEQLTFANTEYLEVIGNIYENPELLKENQ